MSRVYRPHLHNCRLLFTNNMRCHKAPCIISMEFKSVLASHHSFLKPSRSLAHSLPVPARPLTFLCRVAAPVSAPPHHLSAPAAGLVTLTPAAVPSTTPQLLNPGVALGLAEASALAAALAEGLKSAGTTSDQGVTAEGLRVAVHQGLKRFDQEYGPEVGVISFGSSSWSS